MGFLLHHLLEASARRYPERPAVVCGPATLTYRELNYAADAFAGLLQEIGVKRGDLVGLHLRRGIDALVAMIGTLKAGGAYVPLDPASPPGRLGYILGACRIEVVASTRDDLSRLDEALGGTTPTRSIVVMDGPPPDPRPASLPALVHWPTSTTRERCRPEQPPSIELDPAYVLFTSGSTGAPKGVVLSHRNALTFVDASSEFFGISQEDRLSNICPLTSDMSVFDIYAALRNGACIVVVPETTAMFPLRLAEAISAGRITVWNSVPSALASLASLAALESHDLSSLRLVLFAGEVFPPKPLGRLMAGIPRARFCNMYGQTEANSSTYHWLADPAEATRGPIPIGSALPNFEVFALGDDGRRATAAGNEGELYVRSATVALGYWNDPERTEHAFVADPAHPGSGVRVYRTGDIVRIDERGEYVFVGRRDLMVKSRGYRVEIGEIEGTLRQHPAIRNAAVIAIPDERIGNRLAAFIEPLAADGLTRDDVVAHCVARLPRYMVPDEITFRDALPLTPSGKIDRQRLARA